MTARFAEGDTVVVWWKTPNGAHREFRGRVAAITPTKVIVEYVHERSTARTVRAALKRRPFPPDQVRKVAPLALELTPQEYMRKLVYQVAGKPETP